MVVDILGEMAVAVPGSINLCTVSWRDVGTSLMEALETGLVISLALHFNLKSFLIYNQASVIIMQGQKLTIPPIPLVKKLIHEVKKMLQEDASLSAKLSLKHDMYKVPRNDMSKPYKVAK